MTDQDMLPENPVTIEELEPLVREIEVLTGGVLDFVSRMRARSNVEQRWLAIGTTDFEKGMMGIARAVTQAPVKELNEMLQTLKG